MSEVVLKDVVPVILAGGVGRRLRPLSRPSRPKPFLRLFSKSSLLQTTVRRCTGMRPPLIVCNHLHRAFAQENMRGIGVTPGALVLEPSGRNTAPAITAAAYLLAERTGPDSLMLVLPTDHAIAQPEKLRIAVAQGVAGARAGLLVTFGVMPFRAESRFGYIGADEPIGASDTMRRVRHFIEKPPREEALRLLAQGGYYWNSGIFLFSAQSWLAAVREFCPAAHEACRGAVNGGRRENESVFLEETAFSRQPSISIDRAVMEKTDKAAMIPLDTDWRDLGTWGALAAHMVGKLR